MPPLSLSHYAEVSFDLPMDSVWTYHIPEDLSGLLQVGNKVMASFKNQSKLGVVTRLHNEIPPFDTKPILSIVNDRITLPFYVFFMQDQIARYYGCGKNEALHLFVFHAKKSAKIDIDKSNFSPSPPEDFSPPTLSPKQQKIAESLWRDSKKGSQFFPTLLFGVTGSGKTEVYQDFLRRILSLSKNKQVLFLLPEIGLTTQIYGRIAKYFPHEKVAFIHSQMKLSQKRKIFQEISSGKIRIVVGPRSALFSPFQDLGAIVMDEENDMSYKSHASPRYHAKRVAFILCKHLHIPLILGSATPSVETYQAVKDGKISLYELSERYWDTPLPAIDVVDMRENKQIFSSSLLEKLVKTKKKGKQSILFLNRRGYSPFIICENCTYIFVCPHCSVSLTYHKREKQLQCHYCQYHSSLPSKCPQCQSNQIRARGTGTQRLEEEIRELFHQYRVLRMDRDTMRTPQTYEKILSTFADHGADVLIGTQMLAKGLDFPDVELVGIISCDLILHLPDFRASEYIFTLITQISGRSGRKTFGQVVLQTRFPEHFAIQAAVEHNYVRFFEEEIRIREQYGYPPFYKFIRLLVRSLYEETASQVIQLLAEEIRILFPHVDMMGPSSCVIEKISNQYRYHILLRVKDPVSYIQEIKPIVKRYNEKTHYHVECDVDPLSLL